MGVRDALNGLLNELGLDPKQIVRVDEPSYDAFA